MDYTKVTKQVSKPKKRVAGEKVPKLPSDEGLMAQFRIVRSRKKSL
jgi:hypothetical protein